MSGPISLTRIRRSTGASPMMAGGARSAPPDRGRPVGITAIRASVRYHGFLGASRTAGTRCAGVPVVVDHSVDNQWLRWHAAGICSSRVFVINGSLLRRARCSADTRTISPRRHPTCVRSSQSIVESPEVQAPQRTPPSAINIPASLPTLAVIFCPAATGHLDGHGHAPWLDSLWPG